MTRTLKHLACAAVLLTAGNHLYQKGAEAASGYQLSQKALEEMHQHLLRSQPLRAREFHFLFQLISRPHARPGAPALNKSRVEFVRHQLVALYQRYSTGSLSPATSEPDLKRLLNGYLSYISNPDHRTLSLSAYLRLH